MRKWPANMMTSGNLFCGFLSVLLAMGGHPQLAAWLIIFAAVLDAFDGKAARFFGGGSDFGLQFDSLADMVSFGFAPAALIYTVAFNELSIPGLVVSFIPVLFVAIRLARFNVAADGRAHDFVGLSSPLHACLIASFVIMSYTTWGEIVDTNVLAGLVLISSLLMISRFPLPGLPRFTLREPGYNLVKVLVLMSAVGFMAINPPRYTFPALAALIIAGFITGALRLLLVREDAIEEDEEPLDDDEESEPVTIYHRGGRR
jgi:CDP-diacylglycerol---serine O-phosphatidyltransferase